MHNMYREGFKSGMFCAATYGVFRKIGITLTLDVTG